MQAGCGPAGLVVDTIGGIPGQVRDRARTNAVIIQPDGTILVGGLNAGGDFALVRYLGDATPLRAAANPSTISTQAQPLLTEAIARWRSAGFNVSSLGNINLRIADLPGTTLGQVQGNTITLDSNAAGWGWFVDKTPRSDSEFRTRGSQGEQGRMDLLTVLQHEVGHLLGVDHQPSGLMADTLFAGVRRSPGHSQMDVLSIFSELRSLHNRTR